MHVRDIIEVTLGEEEGYKFAKWAFGEEFEDKSQREYPNLWNKLHGDDYKLHGSNEMNHDLLIMIAIYNKYKDGE